MKPVAIGAAVVVLLLGAIGFVPLFGGPGYEQSLATGLVVPSAAAVVTAIEVARRRTTSPLHSVGRGAATGITYAGLSLVTALLHAARVGVCEVAGALLYFTLTALVGSILGGVWGAAVGELAGLGVDRGRVKRVRLVATLLAFAGPLGGVVVSLYRFTASPMIFAFDPFVGYFSGTLYDTVIDAGGALLTYRAGSLATLTAVALFASILERTPALDLRTTAPRARGALGLAALFASLGVTLAGPRLGHSSTSASIAEDLGARKQGPRCDVIYPSTTREQDAELLLRDCEEEVAMVEQRLGARGPERVRAFFFRDENDKKRLMGAAHTYIAKPWRAEVYLQMAPYPHPVLGHELAHVVAGAFGRGPFRVAGSLGGLVSNPGLIEGVAVAASPDDEDLTDVQWARAMLDIGILPPMQRVFSLGFLSDASAKSYTLAGAFVGWVAERWTMACVRSWYGGADIVALTGKSWPELDVAFREHLKTIALPPEAESFARAKFSRPGIFGRKCPHLVDAKRHEADICRDTQRFEKAIALYQEILEKDPLDFASRQARAQTMRWHGDRERGRAELEGLAARQDLPRTWRDRADESLADGDFIDGNLAAAGKRYASLAARSLDEDAARTLEVKRLATEADPAAREAIQWLLLGTEKQRPDIFVGGLGLGRAEGPLVRYLVGRNLVQRGFFEKGARVLDEALAQPAPTPRIARETVRQRAIAAAALGDRESLLRLKALVEGPDDPFKGAAGGRREATLRMIARAAR